MEAKNFDERIELPAGVVATYDEKTGVLAVTGPKGCVSKVIADPRVAMGVTDGAVTFLTKKATMREKKLLYAFVAHAKNLVRGATQGYTYTLKICSGHFPMAVSVKGDVFEIKNFIGEKVPRTLKLKQGATVKVDGERVVVTGTDKEIVGQTAADIEQLSRRPGFDTRIFQDGIFIIDKDGKKVV